MRTVPVLRAAHPDWNWELPDEALADDATLLLGHTAAHLRRLTVPLDFDGDTPALPQIAIHARRAVAAARSALRNAFRTGEPAFSLMRPPGHHATASQAMGFCYLNQIALAALAHLRDHPDARVAVWDFDAHHGNGTQAILQGRPGTFFASVHQSPCYPGTGLADEGNCRNWPVRPHTPAPEHMAALAESWEAILAFRPTLILVSAGFDAYVGDPITEMTLDAKDFATLGSWLRGAPAPAAAVLEGGYSADLPALLDAFLQGWAGSSSPE